MSSATASVHERPAQVPPEDRPPEERGTLTIADKVVDRIARRAACEVSGVVGSTVRGGLPLLGSRYPNTSVRVAGRRARIEVSIATPWPTPAASTAAVVRTRVAERVRELTGLEVDAVDVTVAEVIHVESARRVR